VVSSPPHEPDDGALVGAAKAGSLRAFADLVRRHERAIFVFLCRMAGDPAQAEDWTQEVFVKAWSRLNQCRDAGTFRSWLYAIAARTALAERRRSGRAAARDTAWAELRAGPEPAGAAAAALDLQTALARLPDKDRVVAALIFDAGLTHAETAAALRMPLGTVKTRAVRARDRLAGMLDAWRPSVARTETPGRGRPE
jgi:RNA polymerase sigma-70 factor (ECF subfamily)